MAENYAQNAAINRIIGVICRREAVSSCVVHSSFSSWRYHGCKVRATDFRMMELSVSVYLSNYKMMLEVQLESVYWLIFQHMLCVRFLFMK